jgi:hypothetical protein
VAELASGKALALGRVVNSLCVLTARDGDAQGAMLASWVSQASFEPPGLTVAVKQDRAAESLLPVGASFNLNILAEGRDKPVLRQLLKPFKPAEDRFAEMEVTTSERTGAVIIPSAGECMARERGAVRWARHERGCETAWAGIGWAAASYRCAFAWVSVCHSLRLGLSRCSRLSGVHHQQPHGRRRPHHSVRLAGVHVVY